MFGQFSAMTARRTKGEMLEKVKDGAAVVWSRKAGHNRLHFKTADGAEGFMLHATVIAKLSPDRRTLTLDDGGWASMTTRRAWGDAVAAFGLPRLTVWGGRPVADHIANGVPFDRTATFNVPDYAPVSASRSELMIRAVVDGQTSLEVRYVDARVVSSNGDEARAPVSRVVLELHRMLDLARRNRNFVGTRWDAVNYSDSLSIFHGAWTAYAGRFGRSVHVGCHEFKAADLRSVLRRLECEHPEKAKLGRKAFLRMRRAAARAAKAVS